ncbi:MAG TPA: folylpolyglutamate synthase/dihydrofolate synthase family protein [Halomicronema sp.]
MNTDTILSQSSAPGINLGLENIQTLLANLKNPQNNYPIIHVAGTNGKGSVCAYLSAILTEAGYQTGRYTSPHLIDWTERITINEIAITNNNLESHLLQVKQAINPKNSPTQFEIITAAAFLYFAEKKVDIAIIEVGLGGRLDATNICEKTLLSIITSIGLDHTEMLGPTLAHIAYEKAGILKPQTPSIIGKIPPEAKQVIQQKITQLNCPVTWIEPANPHPTKPNTAIYKNLEYSLPLAGDIQLINSAIAIETLLNLKQKGWKITQKNIIQGIAKTRWPGRIQWVNWQGNQILIDGCHNPENALALRRYLNSQKITSINWVIGMMARKDHQGIFQALLQPHDRLYIVPIPDSGTAQPQQLLNLAKTLCPDLAETQCFPDLKSALKSATKNLDKTTVLCGSLYLIGHFLEIQTNSLN